MASFFAAKPPSLSLLPWGRGTASAVDRVLSLMAHLRRSPPPLFHTASTLSGSLRSPPSPRGEGFVSEIPLSPSNLRPFGASPSKGRRESAVGIGLPFLAHRLRGVPLRRKEGECRLPASSFRANARNLFRLRSGKKREGSGEREAPSSMRLGRKKGECRIPYSKSFSRIVIPKSLSVLWYNMTRRMTRS